MYIFPNPPVCMHPKQIQLKQIYHPFLPLEKGQPLMALTLFSLFYKA